MFMDGIVNIEGKLFPPDKATIPIFDHGFLYGDSVYETIRSYDRKPFMLSKHLDRLFQSADGLSIKSHWNNKRWVDEVKKTVEGYKSEGELYIRLILTRGVGNIGLDPDLCSKPNAVIIVKALSEAPIELYTKGMKVYIVSVQRNDLKALPPYLKTGNFLNNILAFIEAKSHGADEALMCNGRGEITEATTANVFMVKDKVIITPPKEAGILPGITRALVEEICEKDSLPFKSKPIFPKDLQGADELFLSSTTREVVPVTVCNGKPIGDGKVGAVTKDLHKRFQAKVKILGAV